MMPQKPMSPALDFSMSAGDVRQLGQIKARLGHSQVSLSLVSRPGTSSIVETLGGDSCVSACVALALICHPSFGRTQCRQRRWKSRRLHVTLCSGGCSGGGGVSGAIEEPALVDFDDEVWKDVAPTSGAGASVWPSVVPGWPAPGDAEEAEDDHEIERPALYVVATPIGNIGDISFRALRILQQADVFAAEDTRVLRKLLTRLGIKVAGRPVLACHDHNEERAAESIVANLRDGRAVALVSDAGTPLISDPGYLVLRRVRKELGDVSCTNGSASSTPLSAARIRVIPGPCAAVAALSIAGVSAARYLYAGFPSSKRAQKETQIRTLLRQAASGLPATLVLYEAPHRLLSTLDMLADALEEEAASRGVGAGGRQVAICRELTKTYETVLLGTARELLARVQAQPVQQKGEFVILVDSAVANTGKSSATAESSDVGAMQDNDSTTGVASTVASSLASMPAAEVVRLLSTELPKDRAISLAAKICDCSKKELKKQIVQQRDR